MCVWFIRGSSDANCIQIGPDAESKGLPWLNPDNAKWDEIKTKLSSGTKIETVLQHYRISTYNKKLLVE